MAHALRSRRNFLIIGVILLPHRIWLEDATAIVGLDDVTMADTPSRRIAEQTIAGIRGWRSEIPFELTACFEPSLSASYILAAEIRLGAAAAPSRVGYVSTVACAWAPGDGAWQIIPVRRARPEPS